MVLSMILPLQNLKKGWKLVFDGQKYITKPCRAFHLNSLEGIPLAVRKVRDDRHGPKSWLGIVVTEGKFRQVRKMTAAVGFPTLRLVRVRIGDIHLGIAPSEVLEVHEFATS